MAEHRIVVPVVGGSSPLIHPSSAPRGGRSTGQAGTRGRVNSCAPLLKRPALRVGNRNSLAHLRRAAASSDWSLLIVKGGVFPLSHFPPNTRAANGVRCRLFSCAVRWVPPVREPRTADRAKARGRLGTPTSGRHRGPQGREPRTADRARSAGTAWNADLRSAQRAAGTRTAYR